tara:strand:+ start:100 stop:597 length:498 start_codon:yes stop_codon:yes gene_type:complete
MVTYNVVGDAGTAGHPSIKRVPYLIENTIDISQVNEDAGTAQNDVLQCLNVPAETLVIAAGVEVLTACDSSVVIDIGITGDTVGFADPDAFVDAYDATSASYAGRDTQDNNEAPMLTCKVADTIDALMAGAASAAGKIRVWAILCDISGVDETDRNPTSQHDTEV